MFWWTGVIVWCVIGLVAATMALGLLLSVLATTYVWFRIARRTKNNRKPAEFWRGSAISCRRNAGVSHSSLGSLKARTAAAHRGKGPPRVV